jgi:hypothetical protein
MDLATRSCTRFSSSATGTITDDELAFDFAGSFETGNELRGRLVPPAGKFFSSEFIDAGFS